MIKQTWNIGEEEKKRILNLHETATKKLYLIKEQQSKSWSLCGYDIFEEGGNYYAIVDRGARIAVPKLSEVAGVIENGDIVVNDITQAGVDLGERFNSSQQCANKKPAMTYGANNLFVYFDDLESELPMFGVIGYYGKMQTGVADFMGEKIQKDKDGVVIQFKKSRSKSFLIEVSPAIKGSPTVDTPITPTPPQVETIELNIESPFVFDKTDLTPDAQQQFNQFVENIKKNYRGVSGNVDVITSASIDADPVSKRTYNMELSTRRANAIIELLKSSLGQTSLTFSPKPLGQTDQFAPGMKWPEVKDNSQTAPNRRLIIKLPKITKEVK